VAPAQAVNQATAPDAVMAVTLPASSREADQVHLRIFPTAEGTPILEPAPQAGLPGGGERLFSVDLSGLPDGLLTLHAWTTRAQGDPFVPVSAQAQKDTSIELTVDPVTTPVTTPHERISGLTDPGATVTVSSPSLSQSAEAQADSEGFFVVSLELPPGLTELSVTATDPFWNRASATRDRLDRPLAIRHLTLVGPLAFRDESAARLGPNFVGSACAEGTGAAFTFLTEPDLSGSGALVPDLFITCLNQAFVNDGAGTFQVRSMVATIEGQRAAALGDFDNDGDWDLAVTRSSGGTDLFLYRNLTRPLGGQGFGQASALLGGFDAQNPEGLAWLDANGDGHLDLFLQEGNSQRLFLNTGGGLGFTEQASAWGLTPVAGLDNGHWVTACDFDQDGDVDLVVADDTGPGFLFENLGDRFEDRTAARGLVFTETAKRDLAFGDMDASGTFDLFVPQGGSSGTNALFSFSPGAGFEDVAEKAGVHVPAADNGAAWGDIDQDGRLDLLYYLPVAAGSFTLVQQLNRGDKDSDGVPDFQTFTLSFPVGAAFAPEGLLLGDVDGDGDLDILVVSRDGAHLLLVNAVNDPEANDDLVQNPRSLRVLLVGNGVTSNRSATGAVLVARECGPGGALLATREVSGGQGNGGQPSPVLHIGGLLPSACVQLTARFVGGPAVSVKVRPALLQSQSIVLFQP
jgi:hypothetical protein